MIEFLFRLFWYFVSTNNRVYRCECNQHPMKLWRSFCPKDGSHGAWYPE